MNKWIIIAVLALFVIILAVILSKRGRKNIGSGASSSLPADAIKVGSTSPEIAELQRTINLAANNKIGGDSLLKSMATNGVFSQAVINEIAKIYPSDEGYRTEFQTIITRQAITPRQISFYIETIKDEL